MALILSCGVIRGLSSPRTQRAKCPMMPMKGPHQAHAFRLERLQSRPPRAAQSGSSNHRPAFRVPRHSGLRRRPPPRGHEPSATLACDRARSIPRQSVRRVVSPCAVSFGHIVPCRERLGNCIVSLGNRFRATLPADPGKEVHVGNVSRGVADCKVNVNFKAMGLKGKSATNALDRRTLSLQGNTLSVRVRPVSLVSVEVE